MALLKPGLKSKYYPKVGDRVRGLCGRFATEGTIIGRKGKPLFYFQEKFRGIHIQTEHGVKVVDNIFPLGE
jgi:hypothetical protein